MSDPTRRVLELLSLLQRRVRWRGRDLAEHLGVTERTVRRDVDRLRALGYPIDADPGPDGGYRLGTDGDLPPLLLDDDEATAVAVALGAAASRGPDGVEAAALSALTKLRRMLPPRMAARVDALGASTDRLSAPGVPGEAAVDPATLAALAVAIDDAQRVRLGYVDRDGTATERRVEPYRLVATHRRWYLVAWDLDRADWRTFRADRIDTAELTGHRFTPTPPEDPVGMVQRAITVSPYRVQAEIWFDASVEDLRRRIPPTIGIVEPGPPDLGGAVLRTGTDDVRSMTGHLIATGLRMRVLTPPEVRDHLAELAAQLLADHR